MFMKKKKHFAKVFVYILAFCLEVPILIGSDSTVFNDVLAHRNNSSALAERVEVYLLKFLVNKQSL